jgi:hypothetical protein
MQTFSNHAMDLATAIQSSIGDNPHQALCRSAINDGYFRFSQCPTERSRSVSKCLGCAEIRSAEYGNGLDQAYCHQTAFCPLQTSKLSAPPFKKPSRRPRVKSFTGITP